MGIFKGPFLAHFWTGILCIFVNKKFCYHPKEQQKVAVDKSGFWIVMPWKHYQKQPTRQNFERKMDKKMAKKRT